MNLKNLKEACGVFASFNADNAAALTFYGLLSLQHRGQDSCGIIWKARDNQIKIKRDHGLLNDVFANENNKTMNGSIAIGHTRYATTGCVDVANIQPFYFKNRQKEFAIAHNGNISNSYDIRCLLEEKGSVFAGNTDTELIGHILVRKKKLNLYDSLLSTLNIFKGAFSLALMDKNAIYAVRDKWGFRPLMIGKKNDAYFIASETCALDIVGAKFIRDVNPGEVVKIDKNGITSSYYSEPKKKRQLCPMELIYFARPDSTLDGINVHAFRKICGAKLAQLFPHNGAEMVVPVPESSISAALGFSETAKLPYERGLVKNRYISRIFIQRTQKERNNSVRQKLNAVKYIVKGKSIILIDDSIVRGTTIKQIVQLLRNAGAKEIHIRIASPKIIAPSYYGINISTYDELIAYHLKTDKEMAKFLDADSLKFLPLKTLKEIASPIGLDLSIFTDKYVTRISQEYKDIAIKKRTSEEAI